ncbi:MAG: enoyl-CoA hydratase-related protein [Actinomycetota bacterium]|jgi:enoyl-CoA hydratase/carnithine racemase|nr:enoyl-CoA hydratase-related protein [Actinomycetota bacterium]
MNDEVTYELNGEVAWLTINRPQARNALNKAVREGLFEGFRRFNSDIAARVLVLTGAGDKAFCAGGDLIEMAENSLEIPPIDFVPQLGRNIHTDKVTIAAVNGVAYAGGFLLAQNCDLVVAAESARFAVTEVKVGRGSPWAAPLSLLVPPKVAMEILVTGEPIDAARAYQLGLVNKVVPITELIDTAQRLAETIAANAPLSVMAAKKTARLSAEFSLSEAFEEAERIWAPVYLSSDAQEGPRAFREKREPNWSGR